MKPATAIPWHTAPIQDWLGAFPRLRTIGDAAWLAAAATTRTLSLPAGNPVYREQEACRNYLLIVDGSIRVQKAAENGSSIITLHHLRRGQTCELTTSCLLSGEAYSAEAVSEDDTTIAMMPDHAFHKAIGGSAGFRDFVLSSLGKGINELVTLVETVAFGHMDSRAARFLVQCARGRRSVSCTHQMIADELGTAREVVSRLLKRFEQNRWVQLHRGSIDILDHQALDDIARDDER